MNRLLLVLVLGVFGLVVPGLTFAQNASPAPTPVPFSRPALVGELMMISFGARENPDLAFTHDQAQQLLPILRKLKDNPALNPADTKDLWNAAQLVLTDDQKAFKPDRSGMSRPAGSATQQNLTPQERMARALDRLIDRLSKI